MDLLKRMQTQDRLMFIVVGLGVLEMAVQIWTSIW